MLKTESRTEKTEGRASDKKIYSIEKHSLPGSLPTAGKSVVPSVMLSAVHDPLTTLIIEDKKR